MSTDTSLIDNPGQYVNMIMPPLSIGEIELLEIYTYYDIPLQFRVKSKSTGNAIYIGYLINDDEDEIWHYLEVSEKRVKELHNGEIDLYTAVRDSENGLIIEFTIHKETYKQKNKLHATEELLDTLYIPMAKMPYPGVMLTK